MLHGFLLLEAMEAAIYLYNWGALEVRLEETIFHNDSF